MALTRDLKRPSRRECNAIQNFAKISLAKPPGALSLAMFKNRETHLRDHINATVGFEKLGAAMHKSPKSLMRMFGERGTRKRRTVFCLRVHSEKRENQTRGTSRTGLTLEAGDSFLDKPQR
jgi:hypothetical protein